MYELTTNVHSLVHISSFFIYLNLLSCSGQLGCDLEPCHHGATCRSQPTDPYYTCACASGFSGATCQEDVDECLLDRPCRNGGLCVNIFGGYECHCGPSWAGPQCESLVRKCAAFPCLNGATCTDVGEDYFCTCDTGYRGSSCEEEIDECVEQTPCLNGATCTNTNGSYVCTCPAGYEGADCEANIDECEIHTPCKNGGTCSDLVNGYACICPPGYVGLVCETQTRECNGFPCLYGVCNTTSSESVVCSCNQGYTGVHCDIDIQECSSSPCHHGDCVDKVAGYTCYCWEGYEGDNCQINIDECLSSPCSSGSTCVDGVNRYTCQCVDGYTGVDCSEDINECLLYQPCGNGATCTHGINSYSCECAVGYEGINCTVNTDDCVDNPCANGECVDRLSGFDCKCLLGWSGSSCNVDIDECNSSPCRNGGKCVNGVNHYNCSCIEGFSGALCEVDVDDCNNIDCDNGECVDGVNDYICDCVPGYKGVRCETEVDECSTLTPCENGGTCVDLVNNYTCHCPAGYEGVHCHLIINPCVVYTPCQNGARCEHSRGEYQCLCLEGWTGTDCEIEVNECDLFSPCYNNATCEDLIAGYRCHCLPGFNGSQCEIDINECALSPCHQLSTCVDHVNSFRCLCAKGYTGIHCDVDIDECSSNLCINNGTCIQGKPGEYSCECAADISGLNCDLVKSVYLHPSGYLQLPYLQTGDDVITLSFSYRSFTKRGLLFWTSSLVGDEKHPQILLVEIIEGSIRLVVETGSGKAVLTQRVAGGRVQIIIGSNGVALSQPPSVFTEDSRVLGTARFLSSIRYIYLGSPDYWTSFLRANIQSGDNYQGCIGNLTINSQVVDLDEAESRRGAELGCKELSTCPTDYCHNNGTCKETWDVAPVCECQAGYAGDRCQILQSAEFKVAQMLYIPSTSTSTTSISFTVALRNISQSAVVMYTMEGNKVAVSVNSGEITAHLLGVGYTLTCTLPLPHAISIVQLHFSDYTMLLSLQALHSLQAVECSESSTSQLDVKGSLYFGYLHSNPALNVWRDVIGYSDGLTGCISHLKVNGEGISLSASTPTGFLLDPPLPTFGCSRSTSCHMTNPCRGTCEGLWDTYECICSRMHTGHDCTEGLSATFNGHTSAVTIAMDPRLHPVVMDGTVSLRTRSRDSVILHATYTPSSSVTLRVDNIGYIQLQIHTDTSDVSVTSEQRVDTGEWTQVEWTIGRTVTLCVSGQRSSTAQWTDYEYLQTNHSVDIVVGAQLLASEDRLLINHYKGCIRSLKFYSTDIDFMTASNGEGVTVSTHSILSGCHGDSVCTNSSCSINSNCIDEWNKYRCDCKDGWQGVDCSASVDECIGVDCNHGVCIDGHLSYTCECDTGYEGVDCTVEISACDWSPCTTNQTTECIATPLLQYSCVCLPGYHGDKCDIEIDECSSSPCQNGGSCVDLVNSYSCVCKDGWTGVNCHINIDDCQDSPCAGSSQCVDKVNGFTCVCTPGLTGTDCSIDIEECADRPCKFNSTCEEPEPDSYRCTCPEYLSGTHCEHVSAVTLLGSSHLELPPLSTSSNDVIIIEFSFSTALTSTLLYLATNDAVHQGLVIELKEGKLRLHLHTGSDLTSILLPITSNNDGVFSQQVQVKLLLLSGLVQISLPPATQFYEEKVGGLRDLRLNSTVYVGGVPYYSPYFTSLTSSRVPFIGCFSDYVVNGQSVSLLLSPSTNNGMELGCGHLSVCDSNSCSSHGRCVDYLTHTQCTCDVGFFGDRCDKMTSAEFSTNNFLHLPSVSSLITIKLDISVNTAATTSSGVILYTLPVNSPAVCVYVNGSTVQVLSLSVGQTTLTSAENRDIHQGGWCSLLIQLGPLSQSLSVTCGDAVASSSETYTQEVGFSGPLYFGAIHSASSAQIWRERLPRVTHSLASCIRDIEIDGHLVNLAESSPTLSSSDPPLPSAGCSRDLQCDLDPEICSSHGECIGSWSELEPTCQCAEGFTGELCSQALPWSFDGSHSRMTFTFDLARVSVGSSGSLMFRTRDTSATILYMTSRTFYFELLLDTSGRLKVQTEDWQVTASTPSLSDGLWHNVSWVSYPVRISVNGTTVLESVTPEMSWYSDTSMRIHLAARKPYTAFAHSSYWKGCISSLTINHQLLVDSSLPAGVSYSSNRVTPGCHGDQQCLSADICPQNAICIDEWNAHQCVCKEGWLGVDCTQSEDDCASHRCVNGLCIDKHRGYTCLCQTRYEGEYCESVTVMCGSRDQCDTDNTLTCTDVFPLGYTCQCKSGWTGTHCTEEVNECSSSPCLHNAECVDQVDGFSCVCDGKHFGSLCERTLICSSSPCNNGATCVPSEDNSLYVCKCTEQYLGESCDIYNSCYKNGCQHGSTCLSDSLNRVYSCSCPTGYYGNMCELVDYCHDNKCQNEAVCVNLENKYECRCTSDYIGEFCSTVKDKCLGNSCQNGATCFFDSTKPESEYSCLCAAGYVGELCSLEVDECLSSPCQHGSCIDKVNRYLCICELDWEGTDCQVNIDDCVTDPCLNGGTCIDQVNGYKCVCSEGYDGPHCDLDFRGCRSNPCQNSATCVSSRGENLYTCLCEQGYDGLLCENNIDDCRQNLCQSGSTCVDLIQGYRCDCVPGYSGDFCTEKLDSCYSRPCINGGLCRYIGLCTCDNINQVCGFHDELCQRSRCKEQTGCTLRLRSYECDCSATTYTGLHCHLDINECETGSHTCRNSAKCIDEVGGFTCDCTNTGYKGDNCQIDIDECSGAIGATRCRNGGTCINHPGSYVCICLDGWEGEDCTSDIQECSSNPCAHNSTCIEGVNGFLCVCTPGYTGTFCNLNIDECSADVSVCVEGATCIDTMGSFYCVCPDHLTGVLCENSLSTSTSTTVPTTTTRNVTDSATTQLAQSVTDKKPQIALVASLSILVVLLVCSVVGFLLYRYECITPLAMKGSYRPDSVSNLPMTVQYANTNQHMLI